MAGGTRQCPTPPPPAWFTDDAWPEEAAAVCSLPTPSRKQWGLHRVPLATAEGRPLYWAVRRVIDPDGYSPPGVYAGVRAAVVRSGYRWDDVCAAVGLVGDVEAGLACLEGFLPGFTEHLRRVMCRPHGRAPTAGDVAAYVTPRHG